MICGFGAKIWGYVVAAGGALLSILMLLRFAKNSGRKEVQNKVNAATKDKKIEVMEAKNEIRKDMATKSDDDVLDELLKHASDSDTK